MRPNVATEASVGTYLNQWWSSIPFMTSIIFAVTVSIFVIEILTGYDSFLEVCSFPIGVATRWEVYRPWTSLFFHNGFLHITFNMLAFVPMASSLERELASLRFCYLFFLFGGTNALFHYTIAYIAAYMPVIRLSKLLYECAIGMSGVIFAFIVIESYSSPSQNRSIFGFFTIPAKWYPWALLVLFQLLMPNISFLGHMGGILSGLAYCHGYMRFFSPSDHFFSWLSSSSLMNRIVSRPSFIVGGGDISANTLPLYSNQRSASRNFRSSTELPVNAAARAFQGLQNLISQRTQSTEQQSPHEPVDSRFPGQGRAVSGKTQNSLSYDNPSISQKRPDEVKKSGLTVGGSLPTQTLKPAEAAALAAARRLTKVGTLVSDPQIVAPPIRSTVQAATSVQSENNLLQSLLDMGFDKDKAKLALDAANGDLQVAIDFLST